jgi:hypothetical protein
MIRPMELSTAPDDGVGQTKGGKKVWFVFGLHSEEAGAGFAITCAPERSPGAADSRTWWRGFTPRRLNRSARPAGVELTGLGDSVARANLGGACRAASRPSRGRRSLHARLVVRRGIGESSLRPVTSANGPRTTHAKWQTHH